MASMVIADLVDELIARTEGEFDSDQAIYALNSAQNYVSSICTPDLLMNMKTTGTVTLADGTGINGGGSASLSSLNAVNNFYLSFTQQASPYMEYAIIDQQKANKLRRSSFLTPKRTNPKAYLIGNTFYSICSDDATGAPVVVVEYIGQPTEITSALYSGGTATVDFNSSLREPLLLMGESFLWRTDDELERSNDAYNKAKDFLQGLNGIKTQNMKNDLETIQMNDMKEKA